MMGMEVVFKSNIPEMLRRVDDTAKERMHEAVNLVRNATVETLSGDRKPDPDRIYRVPGTKKPKFYQASSPGEPPAVQLGDLRKSVKRGVKKERGKLTGYVGSKLPKAPMLEFGTRKMAPRPWLRPSFEKSEADIRDIFMRRWF